MKKTSLIAGAVAATLLVAAAAFILPGYLSQNRTADKQDQTASGADAVAIGKPFPAFQLVDIGGNKITPSSLSGKPYLLWFTTSWCVSCQIGARRVATFEKQIGTSAFNVVVVFVDQKEAVAALKNWQRKFGDKSWAIAFDSKVDPLASKVALRYLDSKYLVDAHGVLRNENFTMATNKYLAEIYKIVKGG